MWLIPSIWLRAALLWGALLAALYLLAGCASAPLARDFRELNRANVRQAASLKTASVRAAAIGDHSRKIDAAAKKLATTKLDPEQSKWVQEIVEENKKLYQDKDALTQALLKSIDEGKRMKEVAVKAEEDAAKAVNDAWWSGFKFIWQWGAIIGGFLLVLGLVFRATLRAAAVAVSAYPPVAIASGFLSRIIPVR